MNMNKKIIALSLLIAMTLVVFSKKQTTYALDSDPFVTPTKIRCTCYTDVGVTASGHYTRKGIAAGKKEWLGCTAMLYEVAEDGSVGDFIGFYEFLDTGAGIDTTGDGKGDSIINGQSIDVWVDGEEGLKEWVNNYGDYVYIFITRGVG